ncbi:hypothetical protein PC116_g11067 [Phytophthora cactorum]|nr:hypothetical protein PC120_g22199 [Phytophthora cactorum]KAG4240964.1 hypothetical protein PC116_g11067 [Phytophthora cactorum]
MEREAPDTMTKFPDTRANNVDFISAVSCFDDTYHFGAPVMSTTSSTKGDRN